MILFIYLLSIKANFIKQIGKENPTHQLKKKIIIIIEGHRYESLVATHKPKTNYPT